MNNAAICEKDLLNSTTQNGKNVEVESTRREVSDELDFAWLAGLSDGEGCFSAYIVHDKRRVPPVPLLRVCFVLSSNTPILLDKCEEIISKLGVKCHVVYGKKKDRQFYTGNLYVAGNGNLIKVITKLLPYLVLKKDQALLLLQIINRKIELSMTTERSKNGLSLTTDPLLVSWMKKLHEHKQDGKSAAPSTTPRCTPQRLGMLAKTRPELLSQITKILEEGDIVSSATETCS